MLTRVWSWTLRTQKHPCKVSRGVAEADARFASRVQASHLRPVVKMVQLVLDAADGLLHERLSRVGGNSGSV